MPFEIFIITITAIIAATVVIRTMIKAGTSGSNSPSLTRSELQLLLREAVEEGNAVLEERILQLERKIDRQLPAYGVPQLNLGTDVEREIGSDVQG